MTQHLLSTRILLLICLLAAAGCSSPTGNVDRTGGPTVSVVPDGLNAQVAAALLDATTSGAMFLPLTALDAGRSGRWDGVSTHSESVGDASCTTQTFAPYRRFGIEYVQQLSGCTTTSTTGDPVVTEGMLRVLWGEHGTDFAASVTIDGLTRTFVDGTTAFVGGHADWTGIQAPDQTSAAATYLFSLMTSDPVAGVWRVSGQLQVVAQTFDALTADGTWDVEQPAGDVEFELQGLRFVYGASPTGCPELGTALTANGTTAVVELPFAAPAMPMSGTLTMRSGGDRTTVEFAQCSARVTTNGDLVDLLDGRSVSDQQAYFSRYGHGVFGLSLFRLVYASAGNLALLRHNWCTAAGGCLHFAYSAAQDPGGIHLLTLGSVEVTGDTAPFPSPATGSYTASFGELSLAVSTPTEALTTITADLAVAPQGLTLSTDTTAVTLYPFPLDLP